MRKLLAANWKENPKSEKAALELFKRTSRGFAGKNISIVICPPFLFLEKIADEFRRGRLGKNVLLGAQDIFWEEQGPYTSEIGPKMLKALGLRYVIVGHSERRTWMHETDAMINKKIKLALRDGLDVILCVGEPFAVRKKGVSAAAAFITAQLKKDLAGISRSAYKKGSVTVAYEPIWAIGSGRAAKPDDIVAASAHIKRALREKGFAKALVLYGGSVTSKNVADFVQLDEIGGALIGGASLKADEFRKMVSIVEKNTNKNNH